MYRRIPLQVATPLLLLSAANLVLGFILTERILVPGFAALNPVVAVLFAICVGIALSCLTGLLLGLSITPALLMRLRLAVRQLLTRC